MLILKRLHHPIKYFAYFWAKYTALHLSLSLVVATWGGGQGNWRTLISFPLSKQRPCSQTLKSSLLVLIWAATLLRSQALSTLRTVSRLYILAQDFAQLPSRTGFPHFPFPVWFLSHFLCLRCIRTVSGATSGSLDVTLNLVEYCKTETQKGVTCYFIVKTRQKEARANCRETDPWIQ